MEILAANGRDIAVYQSSADGGAPVLFISGFIGLARFWDPTLSRLSHAMRAITYDQAGTGKSGPFQSPLSIEQMADDAKALLDALEIGEAHIVGHSAGACTGMILAARHPDRVSSLSLFGGWDRADPWMHRVFSARLSVLNNLGASEYATLTTLFMTPPTDVDAHDGALARAEHVTAQSLPTADEIAERANAVLEFDAAKWCDGITAPTHIMCAEDDWMTPIALSENLSRMLPAAIFTRLQSGGHYCPRSRPIQVAAKINNWISRIEEARIPAQIGS